ncbi:hypothetical protein [Xylella fastidiosa]|uniref:Uncharacterized protein n=1 Tax=Xylella fastidiosa subsp. sandyi Ann-1 TaxID=155920 RepID=A0A060HDV1_XYLFS|nr:hypothetical protein [Xylella fastidiosa]AIC11117.1 hypothetical protein D934_04635 [Xylella fastidiosa subsp. sandyi Ann-1]UIX82272.1 hypothetical protein LZ756_05335 [Xylella fastidiosa subsp. sandyi]
MSDEMEYGQSKCADVAVADSCAGFDAVSRIDVIGKDWFAEISHLWVTNRVLVQC